MSGTMWHSSPAPPIKLKEKNPQAQNRRKKNFLFIRRINLPENCKADLEVNAIFTQKEVNPEFNVNLLFP